MVTRNPIPLPAEQIHSFWASVESELRSRHNLSGDQAVRAILRFRNEIDRVGSIIYHQQPVDVAADIVTGEYVQAERRVG